MEPGIAIGTYVDSLIAERRREPHDDLLGPLVDARDAGERLDRVGSFRNVCMSLVVGSETTATQLASTLFAVMAHPDHWREIVDGRGGLSPRLRSCGDGSQLPLCDAFRALGQEYVELSGGS